MLAAPCALATVAAIALLGPGLAAATLPRAQPQAFWDPVWVAPEPVEHARYLIALLGPPFLAGLVGLGARRHVRLPAAGIRALAGIGHVALLVALAVFLLAQYDVVLPSKLHEGRRLFTPTTLALAAAFALAAPSLLRRAAASVRLARLRRDTPSLRVACLLVLALLTAAWLLSAIDTDGTAGVAAWRHLIPWDADETYAVLDGRTPLVDFHAQYGQLFPYGAAAIVAVAGSSIAAWTTLMTVFSGLTLLAVYAIFRRILRSSLLALAVYLPFMATGFFKDEGTLVHRFTPAGIFSVWPMRYGGAYLLAWLAARHLDGVAPRRSWLLFLAGGLVALNNLEFGGPALVATVAAVGLVRASRSWRLARRLLGGALAGLLGAGLLMCLLTLARAGALPRFSLLLEFPRLYGVDGWVMQRMPVAGVHLALYVTFGAAVVTAVARTARGGDDAPILTGMLAWSGVFGLLAGAYYVGLSEAQYLISLFSAWAFSLVLVLVASVRALAARGWRRATLPELAVLFGFGIAACSLAQLPTPWSQVARLKRHTPVPVYQPPGVLRLVARDTKPGADVALLVPLGHRIAYELGRTDVSPYSGLESMPTRRQLLDAIALIRRDRVERVFVRLGDRTFGDFLPEALRTLRAAGFSPRAQAGGVVELVDARRTPR